MTPALVYIQPFDIVEEARFDVRVAAAATAEAYGLGGWEWKPALTERPQMSFETMSIELDGKVLAGRARLSFNMRNAGVDQRQVKWVGADVKIFSAAALKWPAVTEFDGTVVDEAVDDDLSICTLTLEVSTDFLEGPLLIFEFDGSGGIGGDAEMRGTFAPAGFGSCENIEPVWFDKTNWIGMIDGYANTTAITRLMEGLDDRGARVADYASYALLKLAIEAGAVPPGRWATCVAEGLVGLGAPPVAPIGVNATFGFNRLGAIMKRILSVHRGVAAGNIDTAAFDAMDVAAPYDAFYWTKDQRDVKDLIEAMACSINATPLVTFQKKVTITRGVVSAPVAELRKSGQTTPRVLEVKNGQLTKPVWRLRARTARPANVLTYDQVLFEDTIEDKGAYDAGETYRAGHIVWKADKSSWLYINATPSSGHAPPNWPTTSDAYWENMTPPASASAITYADGTPLENLKPGQAGADVTGSHTAAAILSQGALATLNDVDWQTKVVGVGKPANNAGTANILVPFGSYSTVSANSVSKSGGTHGAFQGGAVGVARKSAVFISCSVVTSPTWWTHITLDTVSATNTNISAAGVWLLRFKSNATDRNLELYKNGSLVGSWTVAGVATSTDRIALACNGVRVFAMLNGIVYGGDTSAYNATADATYWPKVMDFYNTADSGHSISDIQYGSWTDVRTFLGDGVTAIAQNAYKTDEGTAAAIAGQGPGATAAATDVLNSYAPYGQNLIPLSDQAADTIFFLYNNPDAMTLNYPVAWCGNGFFGWTTSNYILGGNIKASVAYQPGRVASPTVGYANFGFKGLNGATSSGNDLVWSVVPGERLIASCYMHHHRCGGGITVCLVDSTGTNPTLYYNVDTTGLGEGGTCYSLSQYERIYKLVTVPAGYNVCVLYIRKNNTNVGEADSYLWWAAPMLERAAPNQTTPSPYQPGPPTGTLAGKTTIDLGSNEVTPNGGIPPTIPDNGFTYTSTVSSVTISWPTMTVYRSNGTTITIASGSQSCTALSSAYNWKFYPFIVDTGGSSATIQFAAAQGALGTYYGTQQIAYLTGGSVAAKAYVNQLGRIDMGSFNAATTSGGTGGGGGGGWNCLHGDMLLRNGRAIEAEVGDTVDTPEGTAVITEVKRWPCAEWIELWSGEDMIAKVTRRHLFYRAIDGEECAAEDIRPGDLICGADSHVEVTGIKLCTLPSTAVGIGIASPHQHYAGQRRILCHNGTQKP